MAGFCDDYSRRIFEPNRPGIDRRCNAGMNSNPCRGAFGDRPAVGPEHIPFRLNRGRL